MLFIWKYKCVEVFEARVTPLAKIIVGVCSDMILVTGTI
jgi:hypothetical protein